MNDKRLMYIDIKTDTTIDDKSAKSFWNQGDNSFRFNFSVGSAVVQEEAETVEPSVSEASRPLQSSCFAFNFQIPPEVEDMATETPAVPSASSKHCSLDGSAVQDVGSHQEPSKSKKKKKSRKKKAPSAERTGDLGEPSVVEEDVELSAEEQLNRELDWCIEQLELGLNSQKATSRQKEEASRALKTLHSSKAPLVKKRQVMRAMAGDYRKKMEEEKSKQFRLIQTELSAAKVKPVSASPRKCVFNRRAEAKSTAAEQNLHKPQDGDSNLNTSTQDTFVFTASAEEFRFNFL
ncbi:UPF0488 protein C8orf33 homolog [Neosynchiropus ocellatus]